MVLERVDVEFDSPPGLDLIELFHENSKTSRHERHPTFTLHPSDEAVIRVMDRFRRVKPFRDRDKIPLPQEHPPTARSFDDVLRSRETARSFDGGALTLASLSRILIGSYGVTRDNEETVFPRPFRCIPSGGALYPLELYIHARHVEGLDAGLYHYDPEDHELDVLGTEAAQGDATAPLTVVDPAQMFVQTDLAEQAAATIFVSARFYRTTFKYGARGYRFILLEAGHLAQNAILLAGSVDAQAAVVGGYFDRDVDRYLGLDGVEESVVYVVMLGT